jgi:hypothetical protein
MDLQDRTVGDLRGMESWLFNMILFDSGGEDGYCNEV